MRGMVMKYSVVFALVVGSGALLMDVSHRVQRMERQVVKADRAIARKQEAIRVLKAEWAYLNNPIRLERLAKSGLALDAPDSADLISEGAHIPDLVPGAPSYVPPQKPLPQPALTRDVSYMTPVRPSFSRTITSSVSSSASASQAGGAE